jgi:hypothetical protein
MKNSWRHSVLRNGTVWCTDNFAVGRFLCPKYTTTCVETL